MVTRGSSLSLKVALVVLIAAALPATVAAYVAYSQGRTMLEASLAENLSAHADRLADELDAFNVNFQTQAGLLAALQPMNAAITSGGDPIETDHAREMLEALVSRDPRLQAVSIIDREGTIRLSSNRPAEGQSVKERAWFTDAMSSGQKLVAELSVPKGASSDAAVLQFSSPLRQGGFIMLTVRAEALWAAARQLSDRVSKGSYVVLLDSRGIRLAHGSRPDLIFHPAGPLDPKDAQALIATARFGQRTAELLEPVSEPLEFGWATAATGGDRSLKKVAPNAADQGTRLATSRRMSSVPWTVASVVPEEALSQPLSELVGGLAWRAGLVAFLGFLLAFFIAQRTLEPVRALVAAASKMAAGEQPSPVAAAGNDELGTLVTQFNAMTTALGESRTQLENRVRDRTHALTRANEELTVQQEELKAQQEELERKNHDVERANQLKSAFLANMSHELRTPLNSVIGFSQLLADELGPRLESRHRRYLSDVSASGRHLLELINDILDLSKIEAGHLELDLEVLQARDLVGQARSLVSGAALTRQIRIVDERRSNRLVRGDAEKLRQVLVNLLSNAIKFSESGTEVTIGVEDVRDGVRYFVADHGPGIEAALLPRIFEPFVQGEKPLIKRHQGTGLGLAISRHVLERHGTRLEVVSEVGKGSTFSFVLAATEEARDPATRSHRQRPVVLLVEPDTRRARELREALTDADFEVATAFETESQLEAARRVKPNVLVVSPGENALGMDALNVIHTDDSMRRIPVVFTTTPQAAGVLPKPLQPAQVVEAVRRATGGSTGKILVVDDDPRARELIRATLEPRGYEVQAVSTVDDALAALDARAVDLVMTDLLMPGKSGFDFVQTLSDDPRLRLIPVLVLTALDLDLAQREKLKRHVVATARKGDITAQEIVEAVSRLAHPRPLVDANERGTVLVVDDHDLNRQLARALLEKRGYGVVEADGGARALELARQLRPSVVLMDLAMPVMDGFEALDGLRGDPLTAIIPVIAVTALAMKSDEDSVRRAGFDGYITKPIDPERLDRELERALLRKPVLASQIESRS